MHVQGAGVSAYWSGLLGQAMQAHISAVQLTTETGGVL